MIWTDEEITSAEAAARSWEGTPHMQRRQIKGKGVDCVHLVMAILQEAGVIPHCRLPQYPQHLGGGSGRNTLPDIIHQVLHVESIGVAEWDPQTGDLLIFKAIQRTNHCGIVVGGMGWHVATGRPVRARPIRAVRPRLQETLRLTKRGLVRPDPENLKIR
jgi:cell wall-associated NlpC family hydrolase